MKKIINDLKESINSALIKDEIFVYDIFIKREKTLTSLFIVLDRREALDLNAVVHASKIINKIVDDANIPLEDYVLDITSRERGKDE